MADDDSHENCISCKLWHESEQNEQPRSLKRLANQFLEKQLSWLSLFAWLELAESYQFHELFLIVEGLICQHFVHLSLTEQFLSVSEAQVQWLVQNERLVCSEAFLLEALVRWYKGDVEARKNPVGKLLSFIKLEHIPSNFLKSFIKKHELGKVVPELKSAVEKPRNVKLSQIFSRRRKSERKEKYSNIVLASYMWKGGVNGACEPKRDFVVKCWLPMREYVMTQEFDKGFHHCPHMRYREGGRRSNNLTNPVIINHKLYVLHQGLCQSCKDAGKDLNSCYNCMKTAELNTFHFHLACYDLLEGSYKKKAVLNSNPASCAISLDKVGFYLFVAEHTFDGHILFHRYNTESLCDRWESFCPSKSRFCETPCIIPFGIHYLYVIWFHSMERFDAFSHTWESLSPIPLGAPICNLKAVVCRQNLIAAVTRIGLVDTSDAWMVYNPTADEWQYCKTPEEIGVTPEEISTNVHLLSFRDSNFVFEYKRSRVSCYCAFPFVYKFISKLEDFRSTEFDTLQVFDSTTIAAINRKTLWSLLSKDKSFE